LHFIDESGEKIASVEASIGGSMEQRWIKKGEQIIGIYGTRLQT